MVLNQFENLFLSDECVIIEPLSIILFEKRSALTLFLLIHIIKTTEPLPEFDLKAKTVNSLIS